MRRESAQASVGLMRSSARRWALLVASLTMGLLVSPIAVTTAGASNPTFTVMNTSETPPDGVWFRRSPHTSDTDRVTGHGVYRGERVQLRCYAWGDSVGSYANRLWYRVLNVTRPTNAGAENSGYLNAHYIDDGLAANQIDAGVPSCSAPTTPDGASVYYSGAGDAGWDLAQPYASYLMSDNGRHGPDWSVGSGCSSDWADNYPSVVGGRRVSTLAGWSLGRLGPIYLLANPSMRRSIHYILMFDPGSIEELRGCDRAVGASARLATWLRENSANQLVIMAGAATAPNRHQSIQDIYFAPSIRGHSDITDQVLVCNVENNHVPWSHRDVIKGYAWMINQPPPSRCPSNFWGWHP